MDCINLKERFGDRFKVTYEESYYAQFGPNARIEDPWLMIIPCQAGHICPGGVGRLMACTDSAGSIAKRLKALEFTIVAQDGSDGVNVIFPVDRFDEVATVMKPRRRRRLSEQRRQKLLKASQNYWFKPGSQSAGAAPESHPGVVPV